MSEDMSSFLAQDNIVLVKQVKIIRNVGSFSHFDIW